MCFLSLKGCQGGWVLVVQLQYHLDYTATDLVANKFECL